MYYVFKSYIGFNFLIAPFLSIGQSINFDSTHTIGELARLPDTITLYSKAIQNKPKLSYTQLKKVNQNKYCLTYWNMEKGGIVDPTLYKDNLKINFNASGLVLFQLGKIKKNYRIEKTLKNTDSLYILYTAIDSSLYKLYQNKLVGCWKTEVYQFKYTKENNIGCEYKSHVHSSAPAFYLIAKGDAIYLSWIELVGGEILQKIKSIKKNRLIVTNEDGRRVKYKRNKDCG